MDLTRTLLEWLMVNGPGTLGLVAFLCALGVPLPIPVLMIAAGALVRQGHMHLPTAVLVTAGGALVAEMLYYSIGRQLGPLARTRAGARFAAVYDEAERRFRRRPVSTIYLTRWLFAPIGIPTTLIAGSSQFPLPRFILGAMAGNIMWIIGYIALGFAVGSDWHNASPVFDRYKVYFAGTALLIGLAYVSWRNRHALARGAQRAWSGFSALAAPRAEAADNETSTSCGERKVPQALISGQVLIRLSASTCKELRHIGLNARVFYFVTLSPTFILLVLSYVLSYILTLDSGALR